MIEVPFWITILLAVVALGAGYILGNLFSGMAKAQKEETKMWRGKYYKLMQEVDDEDAESGGVGSLTKLAMGALGGKGFSLEGLLQTLQDNPEVIDQGMKILKSFQKNQKPALPADEKDTSKLQNLQKF